MGAQDDDKTVPRTELMGDRTVAAAPGPQTIADPDVDLDRLLAAPARYDVRTTLGEGGMGEVHLARDERFGREIALKVMLGAHESNRVLRARFVREARVQGQLEHPSIVPVYDLGRDPAGRAFFTMRRIRGETLDAILDRLRAGDEAAAAEHTRHRLLGAFVQVCLAIGYAHSRGVVHRDLKPANVMLGAFGEVYVLDWGLAKVASVEEPHASTPDHGERPVEDRGHVATEAGYTLGTPMYMAPEQARSDLGEVGPGTDVYALGAMLFEILTLEPLHGLGAPADLVRRAAKGVDARASSRAPGRDVPPELEAICVKATALAPADRYASARELAADIEAFLAGDRDMKLRRDLAGAHLARARDAAAALASADDVEKRREALREIGRALALAPEDPEALSLLVGLLTDSPKTTPPEVVAAVESNADRPIRRLQRRSAYAILGGGAVIGILFASAGIRDLRLFVAALGGWAATGVIVWSVARWDRRYRARFPYTAFVYAFAVAGLSMLYGPFLLTPALTIAICPTFVLSTKRRYRELVALIFATICFVVPAILGFLGVHPVPQAFDADVLRIGPGALHATRLSTYVVITLSHALFLGFAAFFVATYRDVANAAELRVQTLAWRLRQLVPDEAGARIGRPPR